MELELKSHVGKFFEVSIRMTKTQEDGTEKFVKETIVVDAVSFGDAERMATEYATSVVGQCSIDEGFEIININPSSSYNEVFSSNDPQDDLFYKARIEFITIDERTEKEKRSKVTYLVQAKSLQRALRYIDKIMSGTMVDYDSVGIVHTGFVDCVFHDIKQNSMPDE